MERMRFLFFDAANTPLFFRDDAEQAEHNHEEMSLYCLFPYHAGKTIRRGMRIGYTDARGVFQCFEIRKCRDYEPDHYQEVTAEHIAISELTDEHFHGAEWTDITAQEALSELLDGTLWSVGTVTATGTSSANIGMGNVWQDVRTIENDWNVYITPRVVVDDSGIVGRYLDISPAGGTWRGLRLSLEKNMDEVGVTWDDSRLKTALYAYGKLVEAEGQEESQPLTFADVVWTATDDHPAKPAGQTYLEDPAATAAYGRNGRARFGFYQNGDISDPQVLLEKTWETLQTVSIPDVSIDCRIKDLQRMGAADVPIRLHDAALVEIRPTGVLLRKEIIKYTEDMLNPLNSRVTIGAYIPNIVYINREIAEAAGSGGGSGGQTNREYELEEFYTQISANKYQISLKAAQRDLETLDDRLTGEIQVEAGKITQIVTAVGSDGQVTAASIVTAVNNSGSSVLIGGDKVNISTNQAFTAVAQGVNRNAGNISTLQNTTSGLTNRVENAEGAITTLQTTANGLTIEVGKKSTIYPQFTDPALDLAVTLNDGDVWEKNSDIQTWGQLAQNKWNQATQYEWKNFRGSEQYVRKNGQWQLSSDHAEFVVTKEEISSEVAAQSGQISAVKQTADSVSIEVANAKGDAATLKARLEITDSAITTEVTNRTNADSALSSRITQNADSITQEVTNRTNADNTMSSRITQNANSITQIVQSVGSNGQVTAASIVAAVNNSGSSVVISANHVDINGILNAPELNSWNASILSLGAARITADSQLEVGSGGQAFFDGPVYLNGSVMFDSNTISWKSISVVASSNLSGSHSYVYLQDGLSYTQTGRLAGGTTTIYYLGHS